MEEEFSYLILLADRIRDAKETESFKFECLQVSKQVNHLSQMFRSVTRLSTNTNNTSSSTNHYQSSFYERPVRRIISEVSKTLEKTLTLVRKCRQGNLYDVNSLDSNGIVLSLPLLLVTIQFYHGMVFHCSADKLASLAKDNDRNKKIIIEEGGIPPLLRLLKQGSSRQRIRRILSEQGAPVIVQVLNESTMSVQISVANLVSRMAKTDPAAQPLVSVLSFFDTFLDEPKPQPQRRTSFHSLVKINKDLQGEKSNRENESPDVKLMLKIKCSEALWMLSKRVYQIVGKLRRPKDCFVWQKIIEKERDELQMNCLMTVMGIAAAAEAKRRPKASSLQDQFSSFKGSCGTALTLIHQESNQAAIALGKFACPENFLCAEHSKTIIEYGGVTPLLTLLRLNDRAQMPESTVPALEGAARSSALMQNYPSLRDLIPNAISHLSVYEGWSLYSHAILYHLNFLVCQNWATYGR
ncbi:hypothetical protein MKW92_018864 [Papaver armeniacum]|nr:hypothetical protein MKW92_018864 [Papaver armeniacum]